MNSVTSKVSPGSCLQFLLDSFRCCALFDKFTEKSVGYILSNDIEVSLGPRKLAALRICNGQEMEWRRCVLIPDDMRDERSRRNVRGDNIVRDVVVVVLYGITVIASCMEGK